jgi:hypothetical protein
MKSILASPDREPRTSLIGRLAFPLLAMNEASHVESFCHQISFPVSQETGALVIDAEFTVADWRLVPQIAKEIGNGRLRVEACGVVDDTGDHDGIVALFNERPVMTVFASSENSLRVRIGGHENSAVVHDGVLPQLSRDAASMNAETETSTDTRDRRRNTNTAARSREAQTRKAKARARMTLSQARNLPLPPMPRFVVRLVGNIGAAAVSAASTLQAVLHRDRAPRLDDAGLALPGPAQIGVLADHIKIGLAVNVLQTFHALQGLGLTEKGADDKIEEQLRAGYWLGAAGFLRKIGRANFKEWTGAETEDEIAGFCQVKYDRLAQLGHQMPQSDRLSRIRAEVSAIKPLSRAYGRAVTILKAFETSITTSSGLARAEIRKAYERQEATFSRVDLIAIAISADVNPLALWPKRSDISGDEFELLRFIGRLQRGTHAVLLRTHFIVVRSLFATAVSQRTEVQQIIAEALSGFFTPKEFIAALDFVEARGDALVIARRTREFAVGEAVTRPDREGRQ